MPKYGLDEASLPLSFAKTEFAYESIAAWLHRFARVCRNTMTLETIADDLLSIDCATGLVVRPYSKYPDAVLERTSEVVAPQTDVLILAQTILTFTSKIWTARIQCCVT